MGLFTKEKTTKDYLKEIAEAQKSDAKIARKSYDLERKAIQAQRDAEIAKEQGRIEQHNKESREAQLQDLINIHFDPENPTDIIQTLTALAAQVDMWLKKTGKFKRHLEAAGSKFDMGIAILTGVDPSNAMLPYFHKKREDWNVLIARKKKNKIRATLIIWGVVAIVTILDSILLLFVEDTPGLFTMLAIASAGVAMIFMWADLESDND